VRGKRPNLGTLVDDFERHGRDIAIVSGRGVRTSRITYKELAHLARRFATELANRGIQKGDRVILCGANSPEWVAAFFGCVLQGVLAVPLDFGSSDVFLKRIENEVRPQLILTDAEKITAFAGPTLLLPQLGESIAPEPVGQAATITPSDPFQIIFTSGTTGEPKGVVHTHRNVLASLEPIETEVNKYLKYERIFHPIRILHTLPLSHVFGQFMGLWTPALLAAEIHFETRLVASELINRIRTRRISVICAVPRVLGLLQQHVAQQFKELPRRIENAQNINPWQRWWRFRDVHRAFGLKCWAFICGGAALLPELEQFWKRMGFVVVQGYGMTETTALVSLNHPFKAAQGTIGQILPGREVKLGPDGEVLVRGETISDTVWQGGEARRREDEWLATGDLADFDANGNLRFRSRKKDVIVTAAGLNIYPEDLEAALRQPGVRDVAVLEVDGPAGPEPMGALLLEQRADPIKIVDSANARLAEFQRVHRWLVWPQPDFPRTSTGKVLKREIAAYALDNQAMEQDEPLALDSLGRVELQAKLERRYGVSLDETALQKIRTTADIAAAVAQSSTDIESRTTATKRPVRSGRPAQEHRYPEWPWHPVQQAIRAVFLECVAMPLVHFLAAPHIERPVIDLPPGPAFIVANHVTSYDVPLVLVALPRRLRSRCAAAMSGEMLLDMRLGRNQGHWFLDLVSPIGYWLITALFNVFPLPQKSGFQRSFEHAGQAVDRGYSVVVFPEGRRSDDGSIQPFMRGSGLLWKQLRVPAIAVHLEGLGELKRRRARWFRSRAISVAVRAVLAFDDNASANDLTARLEAAYGSIKPAKIS
jgi:long-chain acyl-CoA synthetase